MLCIYSNKIKALDDCINIIQNYIPQGSLYKKYFLFAQKNNDKRKVKLYYLKKGLDLAENEKNIPRQIEFYYFIGRLYKGTALYSKYILKASSLIKTGKESILVCCILKELANIYIKNREYYKALKYYDLALDFSSGKIGCKVTLFMRIAKLYKKLKDKENAFKYLNKVDKLTKSLKNKQLILELSIAKARFYKDYDNNIELKLINKAINILKEHIPQRRKIWIYANLGNYYFNNRNYFLAEKFYKETIKIDDQNKYHNLISEAYMRLSQIYFEKDDFTKMYAILKIKEERNIISHNEILQEEIKAFEKDIEDISDFIGKVNRAESTNLNLIIILILLFILLCYIIYKTYKYLNEKIKFKRKADNLEEINFTKDRFMSIIAHDIKSPFAGIISSVSFLLDLYDEIDDNQKKEMLTEISKSSNNALLLINDLLAWSSSQTNSIKFSPKHFDVSKLIYNEIKFNQVQAENKHIKLISNLDQNINAFADINMTRTVLRNLISNAIKFTEMDGKIEVDVVNNQNEVQISVIDNGVGMTKNVSSNIFNIGKKISTKGTANETGTGLGLALCKEFITKNNGKIWFETQKDMGTKFFITLPISKN